MGGLRRGSEGPVPRILLCGCSFGLAQVPEGGVPDKPLARGVETPALRPLSPLPAAGPSKSGCWCPGPSSRPPRAGAHRVGCGGSVAGSERRQGDGGGRAGPHSAPGGPRTEPRGSLKLANGAVPSSAWQPRAGGDKRGSRGRKSPGPRGPAPPHPTPPGCGARSPPGRARDLECERPGSGERPGTQKPGAPAGGAPVAANLSRVPRARASSRPRQGAGLGRAGGPLCGRP